MKGCESPIHTSLVSLSNKSSSDLQFYQLKRRPLFLPLGGGVSSHRGRRGLLMGPPNIWRHDMGSDPWNQTRRGDEEPSERLEGAIVAS